MPRRSRPVRGVSALERPRQGILARVLSACGGFSHSRRGSRANDYRTKLLAYSHYDSYKLNGEDSQIHWEAMTATSHRHVKILQFTTAGLVILIGSSLAAIAAGLAWMASMAHEAMAKQTLAVMWPEDGESEEPNAFSGYLAFVGIRLAMATAAALLVYWQPHAAVSGLPKIKSNLNGTKIPGYLSFRVLVAKIVGTTLVVGSGLPLGKEGPMVHIGATVASLLSNVKLSWMRSLYELRMPSSQRGWVGMGAAAGVAAAFHAPLGGILYSFEEVCSHWSASMTWRSFLCAVAVAAAGTFFVEFAGIGHGEFVVGVKDNSHFSYAREDIGWFCLLGITGGALGAAYNEVVKRVNHLRGGFLKGKPANRVALLKLIEAVTLALVCFTIFYALPFGFSCVPCPTGSTCHPDGAISSASSGSISGVSSGDSSGDGPCPISSSGDRSGRRSMAATASLPDPEDEELHDGTPLGLYKLEYVRFNCGAHEHNEMATLMQSGQEGLLKHLYMRSHAHADRSGGDTVGMEPTLTCCATLLAVYFILATSMFGVGLPSGNFVPGMSIGGLLGRVVGQLAFDAGLIYGRQRGTFALIGTAAVLGGMTRMTLTLSVILSEITQDVKILPALMFTLALSRAVGDALTHSFDDMMIHILGLPYLEEEVPQELEVLAARDVMSSPVRSLPEKVKVSELLAKLRSAPHNGFPIVGSKLETRNFTTGLILRQQLEVILELKLWGKQSGKELPLSDEVRHQYIGAITMADTAMRLDPKERRSSMPMLRRGDSGDPTHRRRGNVLSSADMVGVARRRNSQGGPYSSRGSPPTSSKGGSFRGRNGTSAAAATAAAAAAVPERQDAFKEEVSAVGEARVDSTRSEGAGKEGAGKEGAGKEGAGKEGAGKEAVLFSASEQGPAVFSQQDLDTVVDLRVFMDPAPHTISELAPMSSVYHMFNQMGVRHLPVFDERQRLCGIITRKDMVPELIEAKLYENTEKRQRAARKLQLMRTAAAALKKKSFSARAIHGNTGSNPAVANLDSRRRPSLGCYSNSSAEAAEDARKAEKQRKGSGAGNRFADRFAYDRSRPDLTSRPFAHVPLASLAAPVKRSNSAPGRLCTRSPGRDASTGILRPPGGGATPGKERKDSGCGFVVSGLLPP